jgi:hypothetical protein
MSLVHGRARQPQSQGSIERANADIKKMLATWMREHKSLKWSIGCKFIQLQKNLSHHMGNSCSPYKAVFDIDTPKGLSSTTIPLEEWTKLDSATDLFKLIGHDPNNEFCDDDVDILREEFDKFNPTNYGIEVAAFTSEDVVAAVTSENAPAAVTKEMAATSKVIEEPAATESVVTADTVVEKANSLLGIIILFMLILFF